MAHPKIVYILPTYSQFEYVRRCLQSLERASPWVSVQVVDDASPDWDRAALSYEGTLGVLRHALNRGLTAAWNAGFAAAFAQEPDYIVAGNSDVLFSAGWWEPLIAALEKPTVVLSGPLSNAPGVSARGLQDVTHWLKDYPLTDDPQVLDEVARRLREAYGDRCEPCDVNGFFMMARATDWRRFAYDGEHVFPPAIRVMPSGKKNRTPHMTGQEDWLCARLRAAGYRAAVALGSFIWHYRSVSRGEQFAKGNWYRINDARPT